MEESFSAGTLAGMGSFRCESCGFAIALGAHDQVPICPNCDSEVFSRASMFLGTEPLAPVAGHTAEREPDWLESMRTQVEDEPGHYLGFDDGERITVLPLTREWTRIGRSLAADVRLDDPTVSRRHAMIVRQPDGIRVLDDRSMNGVFVNGERVEWSRLTGGDQVTVGRYELYFLDSTTEAPATAGLDTQDAAA